jgi:aspartyl-tRNA(Asn)/glutamyl-tRNA(Gln) amidotransferase subunit A
VPFDTINVDGDRVPCGVQVIARPWEDLTALNVMAALERAASFEP